MSPYLVRYFLLIMLIRNMELKGMEKDHNKLKSKSSIDKAIFISRLVYIGFLIY